MSFRLKRSLPRYYTAAHSASPTIKRDILQGTSVQDHLHKIAETNGQVVLADIERLRPRSHAPPGTPTYEAQYTQLVEKITSSFNAKQLRQFLKLYDISVPSDRKKNNWAAAIIEEQWNWPPLAAIREQERAAEMSVETLPLTPTQAFLILGKDGADSRALSKKYHVRMTYLSNPLSLRIEGTVGCLATLRGHIGELKLAISQGFFELPAERVIRSDVLHRVSRLSGALVEDVGGRKLRISFIKHNPRTARVAKRLLAQALCEESDTKQRRLFFHLPPSIPSFSTLPAATNFPHAYALFPFLSPRSLPWTVSESGVFRLRRVEDWLGKGAIEDLKKTGGLLMGRGHLLTLQQQEADLRALLLAGFLNSGPSPSRVVTASIGHVLVTSAPGHRYNIIPPLQGNWKVPYILNWMKKLSEPVVFARSLPTHLLDSPVSERQMLHRLDYRAVTTKGDAGKTIKVETVLPQEATGASIQNSGFEKPAFRSSCLAGHKVDLDVLMPDRPADIRFSAFDTTDLAAGQWPQELDEYMSNLRAFLSYDDRDASQPEPPLVVDYEGVQYILHSASTVRRKVERLDPSSIQVITESALDLDGEQKTASCQVVCEDIESDAAWKSFLRQCDSVSTAPAPASITRHAVPVF